jgi:hypothetical protein
LGRILVFNPQSYQIRIYNPSNHPYLLLFFTLRTLSLCGSLKKGLFNPDFITYQVPKV